MKRLRRFKPVLLVVAATVAGCSAPLVAQAPKASTPAVARMSCTERSAVARPPKNAIVELAWCIAETDDLYDPDHLFRETLGIKNYDTSEGIPAGVQAAVGREGILHLPVGIDGFLFMRKNPKSTGEYGERYLSFRIDPQKACVRLEDIFATFGRDFRLSQVPISAPGTALPTVPSSIEQPKRNPYGISYRTAALFGGDPRGAVNFDFRYHECLLHVDVQRNLDLITYQQLLEKAK